MVGELGVRARVCGRAAGRRRAMSRVAASTTTYRLTAQQSSGNRVVNKLPVTHQLMSPNHPSQTWRSSQFVRMHTSPELSEP